MVLWFQSFWASTAIKKLSFDSGQMADGSALQGRSEEELDAEAKRGTS
jgi:hypothetical protein